MDTTGKWTGIITYGREYREFEGTTVQFELVITQKENKVKGLSIDIEGFGINPDPADIEGEVIGNELRFIKQYRSIHVADKQNTIDKSRKGPKIVYQGKYDTNSKEFKVTWEMGIIRIFFGLIPINRRCTGYWKMRKLKNMDETQNV